MIEAAMIWNEPNNKSHWDPDLDPNWSVYARTVAEAGRAIESANPEVTRVLGGISPIDPHFINNLGALGALDHGDVVAVHGFPLDWNNWRIDEWPEKLDEIRAVTELPLGKPSAVSANGHSGFSAQSSRLPVTEPPPQLAKLLQQLVALLEQVEH